MWEGEAADWEEPTEGLYGRAVGELLLLVTGGLQGRPAEPWAGPVFTPLLPYSAARQLCHHHECCPPVQPCHQPHHQHWPYYLLGLSHATAQLTEFTRPLREWAWLCYEEWGTPTSRQPRYHCVRGNIQSDSNSRLLSGNDWEMYNRRAAKEGL